MPIDYKKYPENWKTEIRPAVLKRAGNKCEGCGIPNYAVGWRNEQGSFMIDNATNIGKLAGIGWDFIEVERKTHGFSRGI